MGLRATGVGGLVLGCDGGMMMLILFTKHNSCDQGLMGMKVGGKRKLFVPSHLGYGERQFGAHIKPHSNLIFEIELLEVLTRDD